MGKMQMKTADDDDDDDDDGDDVRDKFFRTEMLTSELQEWKNINS